MTKVISVYEKVAKIPIPKRAFIKKNFKFSTVEVVWSQQNLLKKEEDLFLINYSSNKTIPPSFPVKVANETWRVNSKSNNLMAILREEKKDKEEAKQTLEIWDKEGLRQQMVVTPSSLHGFIYDKDGIFGCGEWSGCEEKLVYTSEKKEEGGKSKSFYEEDLKEEDNVGKKYEYKEGWGDQLNNKKNSIVCVYHINTNRSQVIDWLPSSYSYGQATWGENGDTLFIVAHLIFPYKLGIIYCPIRPSVIMKVNIQTKLYEIVGPKDMSVRSLRYNSVTKQLLFLVNPHSGPHKQYSKLYLLNNNINFNNNDNNGSNYSYKIIQLEDYQDGLSCQELPENCWLHDNKRILINYIHKTIIKVLAINLETGRATVISDEKFKGSQEILHIRQGKRGLDKIKQLEKEEEEEENGEDEVVLVRSSFDQPPQIVWGIVPEEGNDRSVEMHPLSTPHPLPFLKYSVHSINPQDNGLEYEYIFIEKIKENKNEEEGGNEKKEENKEEGDGNPLIVYNHGGPHSNFINKFSVCFSAYCCLGYSLLLTNYRGSFGYGKENLESLLGKVGTQDIQDVKVCLDKILNETKTKINKNKLVVAGGSHGGFISAHLIGQYPSLFKAALLLNPVINLTTLLGTNDIPDWIYTEVGLTFDPGMKLDQSLLNLLYSSSPIKYAHQVKTPVFLSLGGKDMRVPSSQGFQFSNVLSTNNVPVKIFFYPDSSHNLGGVEVQADQFINSTSWIEKCLKEELK